MASSEKDFIENSWAGRNIIIGEEVLLKITRRCTRCVMTTLPQSDLPKDLGVLRTIARYNEVTLGVYASVLRRGTIRRGDSVRLE